MKFLIWFGCVFVLSVITVLFKYAGVLLGFIPTFILGSLMFWIASKLCRKWDMYKESRKNKKDISLSECVKKVERKQIKFIMTLINIVVLIFPVLFSAIILYDGTYIDELYFMVVFSGIFAMILEVLKLKILKKNIIVSVLLIISSGIMFVPVLTADLWEEDVVIAAFSCFSSLYVLCYEGYSLFSNKYYDTHSYKMKCYKKVADMQEYLEKGIITQVEFEKNKKDILKRIKTEVNNNYPKMGTTVIKKVEEDKIVPNKEESTKSVIRKESAPLVRDDVFQDKVETVKAGELSDVEWECLYKSDFEKFWEMVIEEYDLSKLPDKIGSLRDDTIIYGEDAKKMYLSRLKGVVEYNEWTTTNRPEVIDIHWNTLIKLKKELKEKTSEKVYMLDVIKNYEDKYIRY